MGYPNSVEEIDSGMLAEGLDELLDSDSAEKTFYEMERDIRNGKRYTKWNAAYYECTT